MCWLGAVWDCGISAVRRHNWREMWGGGRFASQSKEDQFSDNIWHFQPVFCLMFFVCILSSCLVGDLDKALDEETAWKIIWVEGLKTMPIKCVHSTQRCVWAQSFRSDMWVRQSWSPLQLQASDPRRSGVLKPAEGRLLGLGFGWSEVDRYHG